MSAEFDMSHLGAFVDGALSADENARVEAHLAQSPESRRIVESLRDMNARLSVAFDAPLYAPVPSNLLAACARPDAGRSLVSRWRPAVGMALAASIALALGVFIGGYRHGTPPVSGVAGFLDTDSALRALLDTAPTGASTAIGDGRAMLASTFLDAEGRPCRELELASSDSVTLTRAIACRENDGWSVNIAVTQTVGSTSATSGYAPASGPGSDAIDAALDALGAGPVLTPAEVSDLIDAGWHSR